MKVVTLWAGDGSLEQKLGGVLPGPPVAIAPSPGRPEHWPAAPPGTEYSVTAPSRVGQDGIDGFISLVKDEPLLEKNRLATVGEYTADEYKGCRATNRTPYQHAVALWWLGGLRPKWFVVAMESSRLMSTIAHHWHVRERFSRVRAVHRFRMAEDGSYVPDGTSFLYGTTLGDPGVWLTESTDIAQIVKEISTP